jgi:cysteinyl-tRNA synthetase
VVTLAEARQAARSRKDWAASDELRRQITDMGWSVQDTPQGWKLVRG